MIQLGLGFVLGSFVTFVILASYGYKKANESVSISDERIRELEERIYQSGYVSGYNDGQQNRIETLPIRKN